MDTAPWDWTPAELQRRRREDRKLLIIVATLITVMFFLTIGASLTNRSPP